MSKDLKEMRSRSMPRLGKIVPGRGNHQCKSPEAGVCLTLLRREEANEAGRK